MADLTARERLEAQVLAAAPDWLVLNRNRARDLAAYCAGRNTRPSLALVESERARRTGRPDPTNPRPTQGPDSTHGGTTA